MQIAGKGNGLPLVAFDLYLLRLGAPRLLHLAPQVLTPAWGRDELGAGEMWNSNSIISWLLVSSGLDQESVSMPSGGHAPGWDAGLVVARRQVPC
jgi:hypothetical protein